jgi:thymidylate kinase
MPGRFITLEGGDGVGKTTVARRLADIDYDTAVGRMRVPGAEQLVFVPRRQVSHTSSYAAVLMERMAEILWHSGDSTDLPDGFWVSLQAAWFTAHGTTVLAPLLGAGHDVIVDGWLYKFWSKLLTQGYRRDELEVIFARVPRPDLVVLLDADAGMLYDRKGRDFRPRELGMHAGYGELNRTTFVEYQERGMDHLRSFAAELGWTTVPIGPDEPVGSTVDKVCQVVEPVLRRVGA